MTQSLLQHNSVQILLVTQCITPDRKESFCKLCLDLTYLTAETAFSLHPACGKRASQTRCNNAEEAGITPEYLQICAEARNSLSQLKFFPEPLSATRYQTLGGNLQPDQMLAGTASTWYTKCPNTWHRHEKGSLWSLSSSAEGNRLYNSIQLALFGTEAGANILRLHVHLEIVAEIHRYSFDAAREDNKLIQGYMGELPTCKRSTICSTRLHLLEVLKV